MAVFLSNSLCICKNRKRSPTSQMSIGLPPNTCEVQVSHSIRQQTLMAHAGAEGSGVLLMKKVQCLITEGPCLAVPDNEVVRLLRESSGLWRALCARRITQIGTGPRGRGQEERPM